VLIYGGARVYTELFGLTKSIRGTNDVINDTEAEELLIKVESKVAALDEVAQSALKSRLLPQDDIDKIIIRAMYIDDEIGNNAMLTMIKDLAQKPNFKNPDDLLDFLGSNIINKNATLVNSGEPAKSLLNEMQTGLKELQNGDEVIISRKIKIDGSGYDYSSSGNEIDVLNITKGKIIECKMVHRDKADNIRDNINAIIDKFTIPEKLSDANKLKYPNHLGQLNISNPSNPYYNLNKQQLIDAIKTDFFPNVGGSGIDKSKLINAIQELEVINGQGSFTIKKTEW
jgi:hypothetical protein